MSKQAEGSNGVAVQHPPSAESNPAEGGSNTLFMRILLSPDGKVHIPETAQQALGLRAGMPLHVFVDGNQLTLQPLNEAYFATLRGVLIGEGLSAETVREDKLAQRAYEEQKLDRSLPNKR